MGDYSVWEEELAKPGSVDRNDDSRPLDGFWRIRGARTKVDTPAAIWDDPNMGPVIKWGRKDPIAFAGVEEEKFHAWSFAHATAVTQAEWELAVQSGEWPDDGKPSRQAEKIADQIAKPGQSNYASTAEVISEMIAGLLADIDGLGVLDTQQKAEKANELGIKLKKAVEEGEVARDKELEPHSLEIGKIRAAWRPVEIGGNALKKLRLAVRAFLKLQADAAPEATGTAGAALSDSEGVPPSPSSSAAPAAPRIESAYGRAVSLRTVRKGVITDMEVFLRQVINDPDLQALLRKKADAYARANSPRDGMRIEVSKE